MAGVCVSTDVTSFAGVYGFDAVDGAAWATFSEHEAAFWSYAIAICGFHHAGFGDGDEHWEGERACHEPGRLDHASKAKNHEERLYEQVLLHSAPDDREVQDELEFWHGVCEDELGDGGSLGVYEFSCLHGHGPVLGGVHLCVS